MPLFSYTTLASDGSEHTQIIESPSAEAAAEELRSRRILVTRLEPAAQPAEGVGAISIGWVSRNDLILFFRQLGVLVKAGVTVVEGLQILERQRAKRKFRRIVTTVRRQVEQGASLADALRRFPATFSPVVTGMVEAGELGGVLDQVLERIADRLEAQGEFRGQVFSAVSYPCVLFFAAVTALLVLGIWITPKVKPFILRTAGRLPWNTALLFGVSDWLIAWLPVIVAGGAVFLVAAYAVYRTPRGRFVIDGIRVRLPLIGPVFLSSSIVQFSRTMASLLNSGVPLLAALQTTRDTIGNEAVARVLDKMYERVLRGDSLSGPIRQSPLMPPMVSGVVSVGEETGGMDQSLALIGDIYEKLLRRRVRRMNVLLEPLMIIVLACVVGFVGWSFYAGIWSTYG